MPERETKQFIDAQGNRVGQDIETRPAGKGTGTNPAKINGPVTRDIENYHRARLPVKDLAGVGGVETVEEEERKSDADNPKEDSELAKGIASAKGKK